MFEKSKKECKYKLKCIKTGMYCVKCNADVECGLKNIFEKYEKKNDKNN